MDPRWGFRGAINQGFNWVHGLESVTAGFGRFASLLDANSQAMHGILSSILRLIDNAGLLFREISFLASGFTLFKFFQRLIARAFGKRPNNSFDIKEFESSKSPSRSYFVINLLASLAVIFFGVPFLYNMINRLQRKNIKKDNTYE